MNYFDNEIMFCCMGNSLKLEHRNKRDLSKLTQRQLFVPLNDNENDIIKHEIANNYRDCKREKLLKRMKRKTNRKSFIIPRQPIQKQLSREILQIPSFIFPRFGLNLPWRGRQTQCNQINNKIECETLAKIRKANTSTDFIRLIEHEHILHEPLAAGETTENRRKLTFNNIQGENEKYLNNRKGIYNNNNGGGYGGGKTSYINSIITNNDDSSNSNNATNNNIVKENLEEWYIQLASRCHNEGFQWHMNYLNDCSNRSALQQSRRIVSSLSSSTSAYNKIGVVSGHCTTNTSALLTAKNRIQDKKYKKIYIKNYDENFDEIDDCKIRIKIGNNNYYSGGSRNNETSINSDCKKRFASIIAYPTNSIVGGDCGGNNRSSSNINKNIMNFCSNSNNNNSSSHKFDTTHQQHNTKNSDKINEIIDNFCSFRISCGTVLPQIILTDFSSHDTTPISTPLLLTPATSNHYNFNNGSKQLTNKE